MTSVAEKTDVGTTQPPPPPGVARRASGWARRAPLLPALIIKIVVTQLPVVAPREISIMDLNPD